MGSPESGELELAHLEHGFREPLNARGIAVGHRLPQVGWDSVPGNPVPVVEPAAPFRSSAFRVPFPEPTDLFLLHAAGS